MTRYYRPTWCAVCDTLLPAHLLFRGYGCEACELQCCDKPECHLKSNGCYPCGEKETGEKVEEGRKRLMNIIWKPEEEGEGGGESGIGGREGVEEDEDTNGSTLFQQDSFLSAASAGNSDFCECSLKSNSFGSSSMVKAVSSNSILMNDNGMLTPEIGIKGWDEKGEEIFKGLPPPSIGEGTRARSRANSTGETER